jgi:hypothetical protein
MRATAAPRVPGPEAGAETLQRCVEVIEREIRADPRRID